MHPIKNICLVFLLLLLVPGFAFADTFSWTFASTSGNISGDGILMAVPDMNIAGAYDVTGGSGFVTENAVSFAVTFAPCIPPGPCSLRNAHGDDIIFDNLLWPNHLPGDQLDGYGVGLVPGPGGEIFMGIWDSPSQSFVSWGDYHDLSTPFTVTAVPEPTSILFLGTGLAGLAGMIRRRSTK